MFLSVTYKKNYIYIYIKRNLGTVFKYSFLGSVEIKNTSSKKVQQWWNAYRDVKACRERKNEHSGALRK